MAMTSSNIRGVGLGHQIHVLFNECVFCKAPVGSKEMNGPCSGRAPVAEAPAVTEVTSVGSSSGHVERHGVTSPGADKPPIFPSFNPNIHVTPTPNYMYGDIDIGRGSAISPRHPNYPAVKALLEYKTWLVTTRNIGFNEAIAELDRRIKDCK